MLSQAIGAANAPEAERALTGKELERWPNGRAVYKTENNNNFSKTSEKKGTSV